jgi:hypothetical protein
MGSTTELLFMGLPETGKTTFFVALDEVLEAQHDGIVSNGFAANRTYLEKAKAMWRAGEPINRTNLTPSDEPVELLVRNTDSNAVAHLVAPDVYGEFFDDQWSDRKWPISYKEQLASLSGILLFINSAQCGRNPEMTTLWQSAASANSPQKKWDPRFASQQVKLVDLLQIVAEQKSVKKPIPLAVMISAWDLIETFENPLRTPEEFLEQDWALLNQYIAANPEFFRSRIYGVSAMGGDGNAQSDLVKMPPHERVWLKDGNDVTRDITRPIRWLLGWN